MSALQPIGSSHALLPAYRFDADRPSATQPVGSPSSLASTWVAQAEITTKGRREAGPTLVRLPDGNYLTIGHNLFGHFGVNASDPRSVQRFIERHGRTGDVRAHSPIFPGAGNAFDVVLEVSPRLLRSNRNIEINTAGAGVALRSGPQAPPPGITKKQFLALQFIGARDSGPAGGVRIYSGQSGGVLVDPKRGAPLYMCFAAGETPWSKFALDLSARLGSLPVAKWLGNPLFDASKKANVAYYVPLSTTGHGLHLIEHNRTDRTVFQLLPDGTRIELK